MALTEPFYVNLQSNLDSAKDKWRTRLRVGMDAGLPMEKFNSVYKYDLQQIRRGAQPLSDRDAVIALQGVMEIGTETGKGGSGIFSVLENATENLKDIVYGLPQLPKFMLDEVSLISDQSEEGFNAGIDRASKALGSGDFGGALEEFAGTPGVRMIPGSYIARELGAGKPGELLENPVFTLLDILPFASHAGYTAKAGEAIKSLPAVRSVSDALSRRGVGAQSKETARMAAQTQRFVKGDGPNRLQVPTGAADSAGRVPMGTVEQAMETLATKVAGRLNEAEMAQLFDAVETGNPAKLAALSESQQLAYLEVKPMVDFLAEHGGDTNQLIKIGDDLFPNNPRTREMLQNQHLIESGGYPDSRMTLLEKLEQQRAKAAGIADDAETQLRTESTILDEWSNDARLQVSEELAAVSDDALKMSDPTVKVAEIRQRIEERHKSTIESIEAEKPSPYYVDESPGPYPKTLAPLRRGEQGWLDGERSPVATEAVDGGGVVRRAKGRPAVGEGEMRVVIKRLDGTIELEKAIELAEHVKRSADSKAAVEAKMGTSVEVLRERLEGLDGHRYLGTIEDLARQQLTEPYFYGKPKATKAEIDAAVVELKFGDAEIAEKVRELRAQGWKKNDTVESSIRAPGVLDDARARLESLESEYKHLGKELTANQTRAQSKTRVSSDGYTNYVDSRARLTARQVVEHDPRLTLEINKAAKRTAEDSLEGPAQRVRNLLEEKGFTVPDELAKLADDATPGSAHGGGELGPHTEMGIARARTSPAGIKDPILRSNAETMVDAIDSALRTADSPEAVVAVIKNFRPLIDRFRTSGGDMMIRTADDLDNLLDQAAMEASGAYDRAVKNAAEPAKVLAVSETARGQKILQQIENQKQAVIEFESTIKDIQSKLEPIEAAAKNYEGALRLRTEAEYRLQEIQSGKRQPTVWEEVETTTKKMTTEETQLARSYGMLDDIWEKGNKSPHFSIMEAIEQRVASLESAGVRVPPQGAKKKATTAGRRKVTPEGTPAYERHVARRKAYPGVKRKYEKMANRAATLQRALSDEIPRLVAEAEELVRALDDPTAARKKLETARRKLTNKAPAEFLEDFAKHDPVLVEAAEALSSKLDEMINRLPRTAAVGKARRSVKRLRARADAARTKATRAEELSTAEHVKALEAVPKADADLIKWSKNPTSLPDRLKPLYRKVYEARLREAIAESKKMPAPERARRALATGHFSDAAKAAGILPKQLKLIQGEAMETLAMLIEDGWNPEYLPHRQPPRVAGRNPLKLFNNKSVTPQQFQRRGVNPEPYTRDLAIAVNENMVDHLRVAGMEALLFGDESAGLTGIYAAFGRSYEDLVTEMMPRIERMAQKSSEPIDVIAQKLMDKDWVALDPNTYGLSGKYHDKARVKYRRVGIRNKMTAEEFAAEQQSMAAAKGKAAEVRQGDPTKAAAAYDRANKKFIEESTKDPSMVTNPHIELDNIFIPRGVGKTLEGFQKGGGVFPFTNVYDKAMNVFRISALALSPRFLVYNALGGMMMSLARTDLNWFKHIQEARAMVDNNQMPAGISRGSAMAPPELTREIGPRLKSTPENARFLHGMADGAFLGDIWNKIGKVSNRSFQLNEYFDNVYRSATYLWEVERSTKKGVARAESMEAGLKTANKVLQDWDTMLPWERSVMRRVFPFYGWMKHIMKYTLTLPFDHPLRVSIVSNFASAEITDQDSGIPQWLDSVFFVGPKGEDSRQWSFSAQGVNPFTDVVDYVAFDNREWGSGTIIGFMSQTSPFLGAVMETMGVNPISGRANLYPELMYDPERGRIRPLAPSIMETAPSSMIPQLKGVYGIAQKLGVWQPISDLRRLQDTDEDAFNGRIFTAFGLPFTPRRRSYTDELIKPALARDEAASQIVNRAIRTGDWSDALRYKRVFVRGHTFDVLKLYELAQKDPELLQSVLGAVGE